MCKKILAESEVFFCKILIAIRFLYITAKYLPCKHGAKAILDSFFIRRVVELLYKRKSALRQINSIVSVNSNEILTNFNQKKFDIFLQSLYYIIKLYFLGVAFMFAVLFRAFVVLGGRNGNSCLSKFHLRS